jgi:hypothetical protein
MSRVTAGIMPQLLKARRSGIDEAEVLKMDRLVNN